MLVFWKLLHKQQILLVFPLIAFVLIIVNAFFHVFRLAWCWGVWVSRRTHLSFWHLEKYIMPRKQWLHYSKCFLICILRRLWHLKRNLLRLRYRFVLYLNCPLQDWFIDMILTLVTSSRIILPGWLPWITLFVFIVRCSLQLRVVTSLIFFWVTEDTCMADTWRQLSLISGNWHYSLMVQILGNCYFSICFFLFSFNMAIEACLKYKTFPRGIFEVSS